MALVKSPIALRCGCGHVVSAETYTSALAAMKEHQQYACHGDIVANISKGRR